MTTHIIGAGLVGLTLANILNDERIPFQRIIDYDRLGYKGGWIGIEIAAEGKHYPVRNEVSEKMYERYEKLASESGVDLVGRLAAYKYIDSDDAIKQAFDYAKI